MAVVYMMEPQYSRVTAFWNYEQLIFVKTACFVLVSHIYIYIREYLYLDPTGNYRSWTFVMLFRTVF